MAGESMSKPMTDKRLDNLVTELFASSSPEHRRDVAILELEARRARVEESHLRAEVERLTEELAEITERCCGRVCECLGGADNVHCPIHGGLD